MLLFIKIHIPEEKTVIDVKISWEKKPDSPVRKIMIIRNTNKFYLFVFHFIIIAASIHPVMQNTNNAMETNSVVFIIRF